VGAHRAALVGRGRVARPIPTVAERPAGDEPIASATRADGVAPRHDGSLLLNAIFVGMALVAYLAARRVVEGDAATAFANAGHILRAEDAIGIDVERSLNDVVARHGWLRETTKWAYLIGNWAVVAAGLLLLWWRDRLGYRHVRDGLVLAAVVGLACYWLLPVAPPRLLDGYTDNVFGVADPSAARPPGGSNVYAAFPSYHVGWPAMVGLVLAGSARSRTAAALWFVPAATIAVIVLLTANHYVADVIGGVAISLCCLWAAIAIRRSLSATRSPRADERDDLTQSRRRTRATAPRRRPPRPARAARHSIVRG
jgi:hypothetical protein